MIPNIVYPPTYDVYHRLCWEYLDRDARQKAKDALLGRSQNPGNKATKQDAGQGNPQPLSGQPPVAGAPNSAKAQQIAADKKLAKEKGWCITFFTTGSCSRLNCPYPHTKKPGSKPMDSRPSSAKGDGKGKGKDKNKGKDKGKDGGQSSRKSKS